MKGLTLTATILVVICTATALSAPASQQISEGEDQDSDGVPDFLEQALLERFVPVFTLSAQECDSMPAEFAPGFAEPRVLTRNGTIYGQVFRPGISETSHDFLEIHYYHLWSRDCGRLGHLWDAEHVSALIQPNGRPDRIDSWTAVYWYAAAHEGTLCDTSSAARGTLLDAEKRGPRVWISKGKHGSFLSQDRCRLGCGEDHCDRMVAMIPTKVTNIGEPGTPMNGALWTGSERWTLRVKMGTDFSPVTLARLKDDAGARIVSLGRPSQPAKSLVFAGASTLRGLRKAGSFLKLLGQKISFW